MLEQINHDLFTFFNATPESSPAMIAMATFIAKYLVLIFPLILASFWFWGSERTRPYHRVIVSKTTIAFCFAMLTSYCIGLLCPHDRPFAEGFGYNFLPHAPTTSFPSHHGTTVFTFALSFLFWHRIWPGLCMMAIALAIAWARVYLGVHWPMDMVGAFIVSLMGCTFAQIIWSLFGERLQKRLNSLYQHCCAFPIRKGWIKS
ncbi:MULTISPECIES: undecaprenyl-diphosphate phosphatase [Photorhabdus]|uniref:undecaprenyl-diphosphate phosphatase n=1 Tax=Photorhabdus laumondii subsp. laumondii (strain DSM 15139 / CIP 105565 / TT01) TaxID=243265 RepID=Q7N6H1_PHOLL|nr:MULTISPECIES: undecaprenyl-diphosphate phosphatase [Photorhabdus]AXG49806.1 undecaprenyl-diphosphate phosphatase [Photorhabdus laumondii subsp. laumondii]KTL60325.1 UDP pyrophosphate phosphatase [Photorhabdus laumondii subsp. laumondii]RAW74252.1 undecaprenyl-diphosphate phosphatase [Photorhabdus sp. S14-60]RAW74812.1 undecaprenyl-diphosphate phosphatase [Photorhabdus sp. S7-51]RAW80133.1 undecaprenyl-diphosphate phosphatase [Photorhabdus sp. S15-56]